MLIVSGDLFIVAKNWGKASQGLGVVGALYSTTCELYDRHRTTTKYAAAALTIAQPTSS